MIIGSGIQCIHIEKSTIRVLPPIFYNIVRHPEINHPAN